MTMWNSVKDAYRSGWAFMIACPLLFLVPVTVEMLQHAAEVWLGMYDSPAAAQATENHPLRLGFGMLKIAGLYIATYWATRFAASGHDHEAPTRRDPVALRLFTVYLLVQMLLSALGLYAGTFGGKAMAVETVLSLILAGILLAWGTAASLGNPAVGPVQSIRIAGFHGLWLGIFGFIATLPLMFAHYAFAVMAQIMQQGRAILWAILALDSLVVGLLASVMGCLCWYLADWIARRRGVRLRVQLTRNTMDSWQPAGHDAALPAQEIADQANK